MNQWINSNKTMRHISHAMGKDHVGPVCLSHAYQDFLVHSLTLQNFFLFQLSMIGGLFLTKYGIDK